MSHKQMLKAEEKGWSDVRQEKEYKQPLEVKVKKMGIPYPPRMNQLFLLNYFGLVRLILDSCTHTLEL